MVCYVCRPIYALIDLNKTQTVDHNRFVRIPYYSVYYVHILRTHALCECALTAGSQCIAHIRRKQKQQSGKVRSFGYYPYAFNMGCDKFDVKLSFSQVREIQRHGCVYIARAILNI